MRQLHPELLTVVPLDRSSQGVDAVRGAPTMSLQRATTLQVLAQVEERRGDRQASDTGAELRDSGTLPFKYEHLTAASWTPTSGDEVTARADRKGNNSVSVRWYITDASRSGKLPRFRGGHDVVVGFETRSPARRAAGGL